MMYQGVNVGGLEVYRSVWVCCIKNEFKEKVTTDCTGNHDMMARLVRP